MSKVECKDEIGEVEGVVHSNCSITPKSTGVHVEYNCDAGEEADKDLSTEFEIVPISALEERNEFRDDASILLLG